MTTCSSHRVLIENMSAYNFDPSSELNSSNHRIASDSPENESGFVHLISMSKSLQMGKMSAVV